MAEQTPHLARPLGHAPKLRTKVAGAKIAALRFLDFFAANIRDPNTRAAFAVVVRAFFAWLANPSLNAEQVAESRSEPL